VVHRRRRRRRGVLSSALHTVTRYGETGLTGTLLPGTVDGVVDCSSMVLLHAARHHRSASQEQAQAVGGQGQAAPASGGAARSRTAWKCGGNRDGRSRRCAPRERRDHRSPVSPLACAKSARAAGAAGALVNQALGLFRRRTR
jgi:hypothetical protein